MTAPRLALAPISPEEHLAFLEDRAAAGGEVSFLQTPAWARVKSEWKAESLGWAAVSPEGGTRLVGAALVLYRQLPKVKRYLAYLPEGPVIDWESDDLGAWLAPLAAHLKKQGAFGIRMGPPVVVRRWDAAAVKAGIADDAVRRLGDLPPTERSQTGARVVSQLRELGWRPQAVEGGFAAGQPQFNFVVPLTDADGTALTEELVLKGMNQQWRRNIKKADKAGVEVTAYDGDAVVSTSSTDRGDVLAAFHDLYVHTAQRDGFTPRPLTYFRTMAAALGSEDADRFRLYLAHHEGDLVAATIAIRVGQRVWYSYGASSTEKRDVRGSNAAQWQMIRDAIAAGARVYDLRGITDTLAEGDAQLGLIQFKVGTGGEAIEYAGEWDLPLNRALYAAFDLYMKRR
ncbi:vancomycin resistance protein VanK [Nocardioides massiliensis]|uniref:Vancomycin resistance protein VanK n=2 Tax=Nocardioides massiliensis TaxID=1325935 RepID=A0ABT9NM75_9ACTN|nr:peptidoglycan bridge formation glycyltransferase FemA/FemB family protein [Nocardioides massiliensis]MDP9821342.1 vancomycin resistance protein VanK [Nocardioides massiliensis]